jgi:phosphocarrier protein
VPSITTLLSGDVETQVMVSNKLGLHARPAALLARTAQDFKAEVRLACGGQEADAKSILDILSLAVGGGTALTIRSRGPDAEKAARAVALLITGQFREERDLVPAGDDG